MHVCMTRARGAVKWIILTPGTAVHHKMTVDIFFLCCESQRRQVPGAGNAVARERALDGVATSKGRETTTGAGITREGGEEVQQTIGARAHQQDKEREICARWPPRGAPAPAAAKAALP